MSLPLFILIVFPLTHFCCSDSADKIKYFVVGFQVCLKAYLTIPGISERTFQRVFHYFNCNVRWIPRKQPRNSTPKKKNAVSWMKIYFEKIGEKMPDHKGIHLPSFITRRKMYRLMKADLALINEKSVTYSTFCKIMKDEFSFVKIPKVGR